MNRRKEVAEMVMSIRDHIAAAWSVRDSDIQQAAELMRLATLKNLDDYIDPLFGDDEPNGSDVRGMVHSLASRRPAQ